MSKGPPLGLILLFGMFGIIALGYVPDAVNAAVGPKPSPSKPDQK